MTTSSIVHRRPGLGAAPLALSARAATTLRWVIVALVGAIVVGQSFDAATTSIVLHQGGYEANPLAAGLFARGLTPWQLVPIVGGLAGSLAWLAWRLRSAVPALLRVLPVGLGIWLAVKVWVVAGNLTTLAHR